jgi:hypothetical protein
MSLTESAQDAIEYIAIESIVFWVTMACYGLSLASVLLPGNIATFTTGRLLDVRIDEDCWVLV